MGQVKIFNGCLPQILLGPLLNTLAHLKYEIREFSKNFLKLLVLTKLNVQL